MSHREFIDLFGHKITKPSMVNCASMAAWKDVMDRSGSVCIQRLVLCWASVLPDLNSPVN